MKNIKDTYIKSLKGTVSISVLVGMIIGIVVLVIIIGLFVSKSTGSAGEMSDCENYGGVCGTKCNDGFLRITQGCPEETPACCIKQDSVSVSYVAG